MDVNNLVNFSAVAISGQTGNDTITGSQVVDIITQNANAGSDTIDGQGGTGDLLSVSADQDQTLTDTTLTIGGATSTFADMEQIRLVGGAGNNIIDASSVSSSGPFATVSISGLAGRTVVLVEQVVIALSLLGFRERDRFSAAQQDVTF